MSFSTIVKTELQSLKHLNCCNKAELSALLHINGSIEKNAEGISIVFQTTNNAVVRRFTSLVKDLYDIEITLLVKKINKLKKHDLFVAKISDKVNFLLTDLSLINENAVFFQDVDRRIIEDECCKKAYLRGAFLASGSINSPETSAYHLEIQSFSMVQAEVVKDISNEFSLNAKTSQNKRGFITYIKEAEKIADFLRVIGASNSLFEFEDSRIKRDFKNSINRVINCDLANEKKAMDAANNQLEHIRIIEKRTNVSLSKSMEEAIFLRKKYPEASLLELSYASIEHFDEQISKSALNHRFRSIKDLANKILIEEGKK
ncbi:MAG: DNA-binding protein WhiA [Candidatus Izemoplasmatales bacterium]|jgi:DNA-binding protein WhiA|nr:DNA-binding protein WhiA [Candidatus Izemoplasmatales bacterium]MDD4069235.1 DNA-binding protein WhiA [Candidatus Izemoplasmatales bacterium]MDY0138365.1 DNA-binding protein WhiA [Candidatus Izemoplasmatales bacterium]